jgi:hypothetical protein
MVIPSLPVIEGKFMFRTVATCSAVSGLAVLLCSCATAPAAPSRVPAPVQDDAATESYDYECDTPASHIADWVRTLHASRVEVRGSLLMKEGREDPNARPVANVLLAGSEVAQSFGLRAQILNATPELMQIDLLGPLPGKAVVPVATVPWKNQPVEFDLSLNAAGEVELTAAGRRAALHVGAVTLTKLSLGCSTADAHFAHVTVLTD